MPRPLQAVCVVPFGMEEGSEADVPGREVGLVVGREVQFRFFASAVRKEDRVEPSFETGMRRARRNFSYAVNLAC